MSRPLRLKIAGGIYHVTARGNAKQDIFLGNGDRERFLGILEEYSSRHKVRILCFALMDNHYHIVIETPIGNITDFMHDVQSRYTNFFNRRHDRVGHLFQGRYKAFLVDRDAYLVEVSRYVHLNPVRAGLVKKPWDWKWSSCGDYIIPESRRTWVARDTIFGCYGGNATRAARKYREMIGSESDGGETDIMKDVTAQVVLGEEKFVEHLRDLLKDGGGKAAKEIPSDKALRKWKRKEADDAFRQLSTHFDIPVGAIKMPTKRPNLAREAAFLVFYERSLWSLNEIGEEFGISGGGVSRTISRVKKRMAEKQSFKNKISSAISIIETH